MPGIKQGKDGFLRKELNGFYVKKSEQMSWCREGKLSADFFNRPCFVKVTLTLGKRAKFEAPINADECLEANEFKQTEKFSSNNQNLTHRFSFLFKKSLKRS